MVHQTIFLEGKRVNLVPYNEEKHLDLFVRWFNDREVAELLGSFNLPLTLSQEREKVKQMTERENAVFLVIETKEGTPIGTVGLNNIRWSDGTATTGAAIGEKRFWGEGYGTDAKMALLYYAFTCLNLRRISASVLAFNGRSHAYLLKQGYVEVGRLPKWRFRDGKYHDEIIMVLTKKRLLERWRSHHQKH